MLRQFLSELDITDPETAIDASELADLVGALSKLPAKRYPQVLAVAFALQRSATRESLLEYAEQLGVSMEGADLTMNVSPIDPADAQPLSKNRRKKKTGKAA